MREWQGECLKVMYFLNGTHLKMKTIICKLEKS